MFYKHLLVLTLFMKYHNSSSDLAGLVVTKSTGMPYTDWEVPP